MQRLPDAGEGALELVTHRDPQRRERSQPVRTAQHRDDPLVEQPAVDGAREDTRSAITTARGDEVFCFIVTE